jgi:hypothetical protein
MVGRLLPPRQDKDLACSHAKTLSDKEEEDAPAASRKNSRLVASRTVAVVARLIGTLDQQFYSQRRDR